MSMCPGCGIEVTWGQTPDGERVPVEANTTRAEGPGRVRILDFTRPLVVEKLDPRDRSHGAIDHRSTCPTQNDSRAPVPG